MTPSKLKNEAVPLWRKIGLKVRHGLTLQSIRSVLCKAGIDVSPYYLFEEGFGPGGTPEIQIKGSVADYTFEFLKPVDMKILAATGYAGFTESKLLGMLSAGEMCIGMRHNGEIAAFMWINFTQFQHKSTVIQINSNEAYLWAMYTLYPYRGNNLAPYLRYKSYELLKEMGRDKLYSISDYFNAPAVKFKKKLNARKLKLILDIQIFNKLHRSYTLKTY